MKTWEAKFLGFGGAWWLVLQPLIGGPMPSERQATGLVLLLLGAVVAMSVSTTDESSTTTIIATWFLRGIFSMLVLMALAMLLALCALLGFSIMR